MKIIVLIIAALVSLSCWAQTPKLDHLEIDKDFPSGCGCSVTDAKDHFLVANDFETITGKEGLEVKRSAVIKWVGKQHRLNFISSTKKSDTPKRGERFTKIYGDDHIRLTLNYRTTFTCPPKDESCEVVRYAVDAVLTVDGQTYRLPNLKGDCGC